MSSAVAADKTAPTAGVDVLQRSFYIRHNLYEALLQLRDSKEKIVLWVDTIKSLTRNSAALVSATPPKKTYSDTEVGHPKLDTVMWKHIWPWSRQ